MVADRRLAGFADLVGFCVDILPLRLRPDPARSFAAQVHDCLAEFLAVSAHPGAPLERIVRAVRAERDPSRQPLVQVLFNMFNFAEPRLALPGLRSEPVPVPAPGSPFDLTVYLAERDGAFAVRPLYNPDLYAADADAGRARGLRRAAGALVAAPDVPVGAARTRVTAGAGRRGDAGSGQPLPRWRGPGVLERVAAVAGTRPSAPAVIGAGTTLSYRQLLAAQARTTAAVRAAGIQSGQAVGILAERHIQLPGLLLGVLASGARWAVLDASLPPARLAALSRAAGCVALLTCSPACRYR